MLEKYRDKLEESELEERHYEKKSLLDSSSSDEDDEEMLDMSKIQRGGGGVKRRPNVNGKSQVSLLIEDQSDDEESKHTFKEGQQMVVTIQ